MSDIKSDELIAIEAVEKQVEGFNKVLGEKADKKSYEEIKGTIEDIKKSLTGFADKDGQTVADALKKINDHTDNMVKQISEMQEDLQKRKETPGKDKIRFFDPEEVQKFLKDTFFNPKEPKSDKTTTMTSFKLNTSLVFKNGRKVNKAAEVMGYPDFFQGADTDATAFTGRFIDSTLYDIPRKPNLILDYFPIQSIGVPTLVYLEKVEISGESDSSTDTGGADWIASGDEKPMRSFRVQSQKVEAKKIAIFGTVHDELLQDLPSLETWLREDFTDEMREEYNDGVLNNNPSVDPNAPLGLKQNAIQYSVTTAFNGTILEANYIDAIIAAAAYMRSLREMPGVAYISSDVWYAIHILKDTDARYLNSNMVYTNGLGELFIAGVKVVPADADDVPSTHLLLVANPSGFNIKNYGPLVFERGLNGEDFRNDRTSFRAYQRVLSYISQHRYNSVLYDTFANIIGAIASGS